MVIVTITPGQIQAWVGLELDGKATGVADPYGASGTEGNGSFWELSARIIYQDSFGPFDTEVHWLGQAARSIGDIPFRIVPSESPFRSLEMEQVHSQV